jgi:hypothetical protein
MTTAIRETRRAPSPPNRPWTFAEKEGHHFQMFDPATGSVRKLAKTTIPFGQLSDDDDRDECNLRTAIEAR